MLRIAFQHFSNFLNFLFKNDFLNLNNEIDFFGKKLLYICLITFLRCPQLHSLALQRCLHWFSLVFRAKIDLIANLNNSIQTLFTSFMRVMCSWGGVVCVAYGVTGWTSFFGISGKSLKSVLPCSLLRYCQNSQLICPCRYLVVRL